jgi:hypothetical protein
VLSIFDIDMAPADARAKIRSYFTANAHVKDERVKEILIAKGYLEVSGEEGGGREGGRHMKRSHDEIPHNEIPHNEISHNEVSHKILCAACIMETHAMIQLG